MKQNKLILLYSVFLFLASCGSDVIDNEKEVSDSLKLETFVPKKEVEIIEPIFDDEVLVLENNEITLTEIKSDKNEKAAITLNTKQFAEGKNHLSFSVEGIHDYSMAYLANNYALSRFSSDVFDVELMYGNNVFLAFLTDKNGISVKTNKGSVLRNAVLGGVEGLFDMKQPHLFYHLPQVEAGESILDFYLVNTSISETGNKVKVIINDAEFVLNKWAAYKISGLQNPENTIRIQLIDESGQLVEGPFNDSGERRFFVLNKSI